MTEQDSAAFYKFFGVTPSREAKDNYVADCPFQDCGKPKHFFFHKRTGLFDCKKCNRNGNYYTFITHFHQALKQHTLEEHLDELALARSLPKDTLSLAHWYRHPITGRWYVPYYGPNDLLNLGVFDPSSINPKNRFRIFKAPGLDLQLYQLLPSKVYDTEIFITEGEWDALALHAAFRATRKECPTILALPGATCWKESWNERFKGKTISFYYDNDEGGKQGIKLIHKRGKSLRYSIANWESPMLAKLKKLPKAPALKDVRDIWQFAKTKSEVLPVLLDMIATTQDDHTEVSEEQEQHDVRKEFSIDIDSIKEITSHTTMQTNVKKAIYANKSIMQTIDAMMAVSLSVYLPGEPLWLFIVGPASCGKSTVVEAFGGNNKFFDYASKLTATMLVSGARRKDGSNASNVYKFDRKTLFVKDLTVILGMQDGVQQALWDILRDIYDGYLKVSYGNGESIEITDFKMNIIAGVTPIIYKFNDSSKGERFLKIDFLGDNFDEDEHMDRAWDNSLVKKENKKLLAETILGYYKHLQATFDPEKLAAIPEDIRHRTQSLAKVVARLQTRIEKDRVEGMIYRPSPAVATRYSLQFKNLLLTLAHVRKEKVVSEETYNIVRKIGFDTCPGLNFEVINYIRKKQKTTRKDIINDLRLPSTRAHQILTDLETLGVLIQSKENNGSGSRGRDTYIYSLSEELLQCLEKSHVTTRTKANRPGTKKGHSRNKLPVSRKPNSRSKNTVKNS